ncbi:hypothetical protein [uncultured Nevskia sp.]|uniref:hypothetical protein n=1 Tax=uncultured Nevskia sp. TaxID=228950 RepID=UPI0025F9B3A4|nr:hypothetical protein [uncultured Nevskia sp.]
MSSGTNDYSGWLSMRELDEAAGLAKGSAFRAFKSMAGDLAEGTDYVVLDHRTAEGLAASMTVQGRLYRSSIAPVLLSAATAARVRSLMTASLGSDVR